MRRVNTPGQSSSGWSAGLLLWADPSSAVGSGPSPPHWADLSDSWSPHTKKCSHGKRASFPGKQQHTLQLKQLSDISCFQGQKCHFLLCSMYNFWLMKTTEIHPGIQSLWSEQHDQQCGVHIGNTREVTSLVELPFLKKHKSSEMDSKTLHPPPPVLQVCSEVMAAACDRGEQNTPGTLWHSLLTNCRSRALPFTFSWRLFSYIWFPSLERHKGFISLNKAQVLEWELLLLPLFCFFHCP